MKPLRNKKNQRTIGLRTSSLEEDLRVLLNKLCTEWGFCIPTSATELIATREEISSDEFARAVLLAEGMDVSPYSEWYKKIQSRFERVFGKTATKSTYNENHK